MIGLVQDCAGAPSSEQVLVEPGFAFVQANVADVLLVTDVGFWVKVGAAVGGAAQAGAPAPATSPADSPATSPADRATFTTRRERTVVPIPLKA